MGGVLRISAPVVEKEADVVGLKNFDQPLVLRAVLVDRCELIATRSECGTWGVFERGDRGFGLNTGIDQIFGQGTDNTVATCIYRTDILRMFARSLQHPAGRSVDHRGNAARLGV